MDRANHRVGDSLATMDASAALPNGANVTRTTGLDLGPLTARGARLAECELEISAPVLTAAELPDAQTITYAIETDDDAAFGSAIVPADALCVQTGAGGVGAAARSIRVKIPTNCERYVRLRATKVGASNASTKNMRFRLLF